MIPAHPPCRPQGTDRADAFLSLDEDAVPLRRLLMGVAEAQRDACLVGHPAPRVAWMWERMSHPQAGDLVVETSAFRTAPAYGLGYLVRHCREFFMTDTEWAAEVAEWGYEAALDLHGRRPSEETWYVQYGPRPVDVVRWENATLMTVLTDRSMYEREPG
jgi:hypothetical protein